MFNNFIEGLIDYAFLRDALVTSIIVGISCSVIGCFIILRGMSLMGDAISHSVLPGVAVSYFLGINYFIGATVFGILSALAIGKISEKKIIKNDTSIGIVLSAFLALGIVLIYKAQSATNLYHILFGNILAISHSDLIITIAITLIVLITIFVFYPRLVITSFDSVMAQAAGINVQFYHYLLMILLTLVAVSSLQTVGAILVVAMLVTPPSAALLFTHRLPIMMLISTVIGILSSILGIAISYHYNLPTGAIIVLISTICFVISFIISPKTRKFKH